MFLGFLRNILFFSVLCTPAIADDYFVLGTTTTVEDSGLLRVVAKEFAQDTKISVRAVVQATGQILSTAKHGNVDLLWVHYTPDEKKFIADGYGQKRYDVMWNNFILIGTEKINAKSFSEAFNYISKNKKRFISRGDNSGTHKTEKQIWGMAGIMPSGTWYKKSGRGMGATLNMVASVGGFTLVDEGTWKNFKNKQDLVIAYEQPNALKNQYGIVELNIKKYPHLLQKNARIFRQWLMSEKGQNIIKNYTINNQHTFYLNP